MVISHYLFDQSRKFSIKFVDVEYFKTTSHIQNMIVLLTESYIK